jgi:DNA-binding transcriptional ArsR family regulator
MVQAATSTDGPSAAELQEMQVHACEAAQLMKTLGNPVRLMILCSLVGTELSVGEINQLVDLSQSALSQHLAVLRREKLVQTRRESQTIYYRLASNSARRIIELLHSIYCER